MLADKAYQQAQNVQYMPIMGQQPTDGNIWYLCFWCDTWTEADWNCLLYANKSYSANYSITVLSKK